MLQLVNTTARLESNFLSASISPWHTRWVRNLKKGKIMRALFKPAVAILAVFSFASLPVAVNADVVDVTVGAGGGAVFQPKDVSVQVGDTVRWTWEVGGHNVGSGAPGMATSAFLSGSPAPAGTVFEVMFDQAFLDSNSVVGNLYNYHCHPHGAFGMVGSVTVVPEPGTACLLVVGCLSAVRRRRGRRSCATL